MLDRNDSVLHSINQKRIKFFAVLCIFVSISMFFNGCNQTGPLDEIPQSTILVPSEEELPVNSPEAPLQEEILTTPVPEITESDGVQNAGPVLPAEGTMNTSIPAATEIPIITELPKVVYSETDMKVDINIDNPTFSPNDINAANTVAPSELSGEFSEFNTTDLNGNLVTQEILSEKMITVINIWGTYCGPCVSEMPYLGEIAKEYEEKDVQVIGIVVDVFDDESLANAKAIIEETGANYLHILPSTQLNKIYLNGVASIPETLFLDRSGNILASLVGSREKQDFKEVIDMYLKQVD